MRPGVPSSGLPLAFLLTAAVAFVAAALALPWLGIELAGHYYHPRLLALTHTVTLGWITLTIMGATYQLIPIVLERPLGSEGAARWQLGVFVVGAIGVVAHFAVGHWRGFVWSAALVAIAALAHVANVAVSLRGARSSFTARMMTVSLAGLVLTALFGTLIGAHKVWPFLPGALFPTLQAHVQLALTGWVLPMVLGVTARVYPMFLLAAEPSHANARVQLAGVTAGPPALAAGLLADAQLLVLAGALLVASAAGAHVVWLLDVARTRKRPRLDWGLRFVLAGAAFLVPATVIGLGMAAGVLEGPRVALAFAALVFGGWASLTIVGMMLKIVPFLVWYRAYGPRAGREAVPTLGQLSSERAEGAAFLSLVPGFAALAVAAWLGDVAFLRVAGAAVTLGALAFATTLVRVLHHLVSCPPRGRGNVRIDDPAPGDADAPGRPRHPRTVRAAPVIAGGSDSDAPPTETQVTDALRTVIDPELGMSIVDLGLVYGIGIDRRRVRITMTLTARGCPIHDVMPGWARMAVMKVPGVDAVDVALTFDPPWTSDRMRTRGRNAGRGAHANGR